MFPANDSPRMNGQEDHSATERKVFIDFFFFWILRSFEEKKKGRNTEHRPLYSHLSKVSKPLLKTVHAVKK